MDRVALRRVRARGGPEDQGVEEGAGTVTVATVGPERAKTGLRECLARGRTTRSGSTRPAPLPRRPGCREGPLAAAAKGGTYDFYWFGQKGVGYDESLVGPMFAELLGVPHVGSIIRLELGEGKITAHREIEGAHEVVECPLPVVLTAQKGLNEPRYASLKGIMAAKKKPIAEKKLAELSVARGGPATPRPAWRKLELPPARAGRQAHSGGRPGGRGQGAACGCSAKRRRSYERLSPAPFLSSRAQRGTRALWRSGWSSGILRRLPPSVLGVADPSGVCRWWSALSSG